VEKKIIYTGIDPKGYLEGESIFHYPLISMKMRSVHTKEIEEVFAKIYAYSHILFTSGYAVRSFFHAMKELGIPKEHLEPVFLLAIGRSTLKALELEGVYVAYVGSDETEEGVIRLLETLDLEEANILLPQTAVTKPKLIHYLVAKLVSYEVIILYDLIKERPYFEVNLSDFHKIVFTAPVSVDAFFEIFDDLPPYLEVHALGLMTRCRVKTYLDDKMKKIDKKSSVC